MEKSIIILSGNCLIEFEKWLAKELHYTDNEGMPDVNDFNTLPTSMQFGVYQDYFDSVGIEILIKAKHHKMVNNVVGQHTISIYRSYVNDIITKSKGENSFKSRQEAREQAIIKACEIRNEQLNK